MSLAIVYSRAQVGIDAPLVTVEVHISNGMPRFSIVGLPETALKESKDRVRSALLNARFFFPAQRITVNLAPAELPKEGARYDLPIAIGILAASGQLPNSGLENYEFVGELALSGELRPIRGALPIAIATRGAGRQLILPQENAYEASLPGDNIIYPAQHMLNVFAHLQAKIRLTPYTAPPRPPRQEISADLCDVRGQAHARRALEIAGAGGHSLLMVGPPGTGKTMLASRLPGILPEMSLEQSLEVAAIYSLTDHPLRLTEWRSRSFRSPHHTASSPALVGGGSIPKPGEISLAHHGILFLDELPEFDRRVLKTLREPLESGKVTISRAARQAQFPANFQLIAAMNPCPCGHLGNPHEQCRCTPDQIQRYRARLSAPLLDRIDMHINVPPLPKGTLTQDNALPPESSATVRERITQSRARQLARGCLNHQLSGMALEQHCALTTDTREILESAIEKFHLSARAIHRILKVALTIADLGGASNIQRAHLLEAISYRQVEVRN